MIKKFFFLAIILLLGAACGTKQGQSSISENGNNNDAIVIDPAQQTVRLASLNDLGQLPNFTLNNQYGDSTTLEDLKGQVWVADFFFTSCSGICPMMTARMHKLQQSPSLSALRLVSITVDPERDTVERLAKHAAEMGAKDDQWLFLTGDKSKIIELSVKGFHLSASDDPSTHKYPFLSIDIHWTEFCGKPFLSLKT